jgi:pimeloyl-ACP methyl ester carboxylesterase
MSEVLRTPEERFGKLPGFEYDARYLQWRDLRIHYLDERPAGGESPKQTFLCLHGEPTWSYLYRKMIPPFLASGARVVAPDLPGFGRSDKPADDAVYTFDFHRAALLEFVERLDLREITLPMEAPERYARLLVMNTALGTGDTPLTEGFLAWRAFVAKSPNLDCAKLLARACPMLSAAEAAAYEAPFPDAAYKSGVRRFPQLVPDAPDAPGAEVSRRARDWWRNSWRGDAFMAIGAADPVLGLAPMRALHAHIRGCAEPWIHEQAGHFVQEWGGDVARAALAHWRAA